MSTLKATYIQHPSAVGPAIELTAEGAVTMLMSNLEDLNNVSAAPTDGQVLAWNASTENWEPTTMTVKEKKISGFKASGTWTVPAGVTYAIAHVRGGGGGAGNAGDGGSGSASSVAFVAATVTANGGNYSRYSADRERGAAANSGEGAAGYVANFGSSGALIVDGSSVTPGDSVTVTIGNGGSGGTGTISATGASGYVYIEYYE